MRSQAFLGGGGPGHTKVTHCSSAGDRVASRDTGLSGLTQDSRRQTGCSSFTRRDPELSHTSVSASPVQGLPTCRLSFLKEERKSVRSSPEHRTDSDGADSLVRTRKWVHRGYTARPGRGDSEMEPRAAIRLKMSGISVTPPTLICLFVHYDCFSAKNNKHPRGNPERVGASPEDSAEAGH